MQEDLISRRAALNALADYIHHVDKVIGTGHLSADDCMDVAKSVLGEDNLPSAQQWIPCTPETMPEREGRYVCTYTYDGKKDVFMFRFEDGDFLVPWYVDAITAWYKPLDPWEEGQDG